MCVLIVCSLSSVVSSSPCRLNLVGQMDTSSVNSFSGGGGHGHDLTIDIGLSNNTGGGRPVASRTTKGASGGPATPPSSTTRHGGGSRAGSRGNSALRNTTPTPTMLFRQGPAFSPVPFSSIPAIEAMEGSAQVVVEPAPVVQRSSMVRSGVQSPSPPQHSQHSQHPQHSQQPHLQQHPHPSNSSNIPSTFRGGVGLSLLREGEGMEEGDANAARPIDEQVCEIAPSSFLPWTPAAHTANPADAVNTGSIGGDDAAGEGGSWARRDRAATWLGATDSCGEEAIKGKSAVGMMMVRSASC